jgi:penicillin-binding protein 1A
MASDPSSDSPGPGPAPRRRPLWQRVLLNFFGWTFGLAFALLAIGVAVGGVALAVAYPNLPDIGDLPPTA